VQNRSLSIDVRVNSLRDVLFANREKLARGIGGLLSADRVIQVACNSIRKNPQLLECTPASLFAAIAEAATYGWVCDGILGHASLVPFRNSKRNCSEVTLIPGYKGLRDLVRKSGECDVTMDSVHDGDTYEYRGRFELPKHVYGSANDRRFKPVTHAYVVGHFASGRVACFSWTAGECVAHRDRYSQNWRRKKDEDNPWHESNPAFRVMCMKTVLLDAIHRGEFPMSVESQHMASRAAEVVESSVTEGGEDLAAAILHEPQVQEAVGVIDGTVVAPGDEPPTDETGDPSPVWAFEPRFAEAKTIEHADGILADVLAEQLDDESTALAKAWHAEAVKRLAATQETVIEHDADASHPLAGVWQRMEAAQTKREVETIYMEASRIKGLSEVDAKTLYQWRGQQMARIHESRGERSNPKRQAAEVAK
jgi:phage RecT family recombinase